MKSSYVIIPRLMTPSINPGNSIEIDIFFSGYGKIEKNKFVIILTLKLINIEFRRHTEISRILSNHRFALSGGTLLNSDSALRQCR